MMKNVTVATSNQNLVITFGDEGDESSPYSQTLFGQFASNVEGIESIEQNGSVFRFNVDNDNERRILELLEELKEQNRDIEIAHDDTVSKNIESFRKEKEEFAEFSEQARRIRNNEDHTYTELNDFEKSMESLAQGLFWHQALSAYHMAFSRNSCNFSVPGAGKTRVVYAAYNFLKHTKEAEKIIVIGPLSSAIAWHDEYREIFGREPAMLMLSGKTSENEVNELYGNSSPEVIHVSYNSLPAFSSHIKYLTTKYKVMMVVDEAHRIKNPDGYWSKSLLSLVDDIDTAPISRIVLTGTPAPNTYVDLLNLFKFIWPKNEIIEYTIGALKQMSKHPDVPSNKKMINRMIEKIEPFYIRIKKSDLGLPGITIHDPVIAEPDESQKKIYEYIKTDLIHEMKKKDAQGSYGLRIIRLRQAASNPSLLMNPIDPEYYGGRDLEKEDYLESIRGQITDYDQNMTSTKFDECLRLINQITSEGRKVLVWCEFVGSVDKLANILREEGKSYALLTGATSDYDTRKAIVDDFKSPTGKVQVILATAAAVGESISLHHNCHDAIYFEVSYNAGLHLQSMDRIHRLGLAPDVVTNYWYIQSDFPIEKNILEKVRDKEAKMRKIIESNEIPLIADYKELFSNPYEKVDLRVIMKLLDE
jgi:SNF2 family DNA or RNA helicase